MKNKTISEQMAEICEEMCDGYCKYPIIYAPSKSENIDDDYIQRLFDERCESCPLHRLV